VQTAIEQTGAAKKFERALVSVFRPLPSGGAQMDLEFDPKTHRYRLNMIMPCFLAIALSSPKIPEHDGRHYGADAEAAGINPPKKVDPIKQRYQIRGKASADCE